MSLNKRRGIPGWAVATGVLTIFLGAYGLALATGHWHTDLPDALYLDLIPRASQFAHPR